MLEQSKAKENQAPEQPAQPEQSSVSAGKPEEEFQNVEHAEAQQPDHDSEFETEDEESDGEYGRDEQGPSMFESLLRSHLMGGGPGRGRPQQDPIARDALHPYTQVLSVANLDECVQVENATFPEHERATREKFRYRLTKCPELSYGVFSRPTLSSASEGDSKQRSQLLGHISASRTTSDTVTDASMALPANWESKIASSEEEERIPEGHEDKGRTIAIHSIAVLPEHQGKKIGSMMVESYVQRMRDSKGADRVAILAHDNLVQFYEKLGFKDTGASDTKFGGGRWKNMIIDFTSEDNQNDD